MAGLSSTTPHVVPGNRSTSLSLSIASTLHPTGIYAPAQSEVTDSPSSTYSTPPLLSSSLPNPSPISQKFFRRPISRARSIERLAGPSLKQNGLDRMKLPVSQVTHRGKVKATSGAPPMASRTVTVIPQDEDVKFHRTRLRVARAVSPLVDLANYVGRTALVTGVEVLPLVPIPGLAGIAKLLLGIWDALLLVSANKQACLRLTDRCASILVAIHDEVRRIGAEVARDLQLPLKRLEDVFDDIHQFLKRQIDQPFLKRYLKRDDITAEIANCNTDLQDCLDHFGRSINLRVLAYVKPMITPKVPSLEISQETLDPINLPLVNFALEHSNSSDAEVRAELHQIQAQQNIRDISRDRAELENTLRLALEADSDAETVQLLQLSKVDMLEAIKMLLRALEQTHRSTTLPDTSSVLLSLPKRASTWPPDYIEAKEIKLLHLAFIERNIEVLKREWSRNGPLSHLPSWTITKYEVDLGASIGRGYFSNVYKGTWRRRTVAVKVIESHTPGDLLNEVNIWKSLQHRNILRFYGASSTESPLPWFIVSPFIQHGSISDYLKRFDWERRKKFDSSLHPIGGEEPNFIQFTYDIGKGMKYLHQAGILHGDLKAANVLVDDEKRCLIADFGQSKFTSKVTHETHAPNHALRWQAPELMHDRSNPTKKADIYAFAMCCVEILTMGSIPWPGESDTLVRKNVLKHDARPPYPKELAVRLGLDDIIQSSWNSAFEERPSFYRITHLLEQSPDVSKPSPLLVNPGHIQSPNGVHIISEEPEIYNYVDIPSTSSREYETTTMTTVPHLTSHEDLKDITIYPPSSTSLPLSGTDIGSHRLPKITPAMTYPSTINSSAVSLTEIESNDHEHREWSRVNSPLPDPSEHEYELTYRLCLSHEFPRPLNVPLWTPSRAAVGDVGYLKKGSGRFVRLFSAFDPTTSSQGRLDVPGLSGLGEISIVNHKDRRESVMKRGMRAITSAMPFKGGNSPKRAVERTLTFSLAGGRMAYLCAEKTSYHYLKGSPIYKEWLKSHWEAILSVYRDDHRLQKEDLMFIIECLNAEDFAMFVNHGHSDQEAQFNIFSLREKGKPWGIFTPATLAGEDLAYRTRVSEVGNGPRALLVSRLRFQPDVEEPTLLT